MSFAKLLDFRRSVAVRLTLMYALVFIVSFAGVYAAIYLMMQGSMARAVDDDLLEELQEVEAIIGARSIGEAREDLLREAEFDGVEEFFIRIYSPGGEEIFASNLSSWERVERIEPPDTGQRVFDFRTYNLGALPEEVRVISGPINGGLFAQLGQSTDEGNQLLRNMRETMTTALLLVTVVATLVGWLMARRSLRGVEHVTRAAERISGGDLHRRVKLTGRGDEIDRLAASFNTMVERIQAVLSSMREITDNIAHDLRSPVARLRGRAELALSRSADGGEADPLAAETVEECDRLLAMINTMLDISELEAGTARLKSETVDLGELVLDTCDLFEPVAEAANVTLKAEASTGTVIRGDVNGLQRALGNVVDNALKYTPAGGRVVVRLTRAQGGGAITVEDTGIGIPEAEHRRIFDRFYRGDRSRSQRGSGLGLSLARALVRAQGGEITVESRPAQGSSFQLVLPGLPTRGNSPVKLTKS